MTVDMTITRRGSGFVVSVRNGSLILTTRCQNYRELALLLDHDFGTYHYLRKRSHSRSLCPMCRSKGAHG